MSTPTTNYAGKSTVDLLCIGGSDPTNEAVWSELLKRYKQDPAAYLRAIDTQVSRDLRRSTPAVNVAAPSPKPSAAAQREEAMRNEAARIWATNKNGRAYVRGREARSQSEVFDLLAISADQQAKENRFADMTRAMRERNQRFNAGPVRADAAPAEATEYTLTAPNPASGAVGQPSGNFVVAIAAGMTLSNPAVITPDDGEDGGTFSPESVTLQGADASASFTYTPASPGEKTISTTSDREDLTDPDPGTYMATMAADRQNRLRGRVR